MHAVWRWPCALIALLLSGFGGLRSLPADDRAADEAERVVVTRPAVETESVVAGAEVPIERDVARLVVGTVDQPCLSWVAPVAVTWLRLGSALGARAP
jgi:hypothetical protein